MALDTALLDRFRHDLDALAAPGASVGIAVSGGPDSLALLLLASAARPGLIEAATVDHRLRPDSGSEADMVAALCARLAVPHAILVVEGLSDRAGNLQARARQARYQALAQWASDRGLAAIATAHHLDDQAETLMMRLNRGSGVRGLGAMRSIARVIGSDMSLIRPVLGWRHSELESICSAEAVEPVRDPSNADPKFERVRMRGAMAQNGWLDPAAVARSAANLAAADEALGWAVEREWRSSVALSSEEIAYSPGDAPSEIRRRIVSKAISILGQEGPEELRGRDLDQLLESLENGETSTLRGVKCSGGARWHFTPARRRRRA